MLNSTPTLLAPCAGASHFTSADDTVSAVDGSEDPNPQSASEPMKCSPLTFTTPTPADGPDDAAAVELLKHPVALLENPYPNPKLTTPADLPWFEYLLAHAAT